MSLRLRFQCGRGSTPSVHTSLFISRDLNNVDGEQNSILLDSPLTHEATGMWHSFHLRDFGFKSSEIISGEGKNLSTSIDSEVRLDESQREAFWLDLGIDEHGEDEIGLLRLESTSVLGGTCMPACCRRSGGGSRHSFARVTSPSLDLGEEIGEWVLNRSVIR